MYFFLLLLSRFISFKSLTSEDRYIHLETDYTYGEKHFKEFEYYPEYLYFIFKAHIEEDDYISFTINTKGKYQSFDIFYMFSDMNLYESELADRISSFIPIYPEDYSDFLGYYKFKIDYKNIYQNYCYLTIKIDGIKQGKNVVMDIHSEYSSSSSSKTLIILTLIGFIIFILILSACCSRLRGERSINCSIFFCCCRYRR